jgi:SET domain-containing protein
MSRAKLTDSRTEMIKRLEMTISDLPMGTDNLKDILKPFDRLLGVVPKERIAHTMAGLSKLSQLPDIYDAPCEVRPSTYGRGVFATRDISKGDFITLYPAHGVEFDRITEYKSHYIGDIEYDEKYTVEHTKNKMAFVGDKDCFNGLFMGHLINDNYPTVEDFKYKEKIGITTLNYILHASTFANCYFKEGTNFIIIQATKDIKKDEELFTSYGLGYWGDDDKNSHTTETKFAEYIDLLHTTNPKKFKFVMDLMTAYKNSVDSLKCL